MRKTALWIQYDGYSSKSFKVFQVNFESGLMQTETLLPSRTLNTTRRQNSSISDFYSVTESVLSFDVNLVYDGEFTQDDIVAAMRWLKKDTYKPLIFETEPENVYYAMPTKIDFTHDTLSKGYFTVTFECNSPYPYTKIQMSNQYIVNGSTDIKIQSNSVFDTQIVKVLMITKGTGNILIKNKSNQTELSFENIPSGLKINCDCYNHQIYCVDSSGNEVLINNNKKSKSWLELMAENNNISIEGNIEVQIFWQGTRI